MAPHSDPSVPEGVPEAAGNGADRAAASTDALTDRLGHPLIRDLLVNPTSWRIWPAVALLRWMIRGSSSNRRLVYRSHPSLAFSPSPVHDVGLAQDRIELTLASPGLASPGSPLPTAEVDRIVRDTRAPGGGAMLAWLDGLTDRLMQVVEEAETKANAAFCLAMGGQVESVRGVSQIVGGSAPLNARADGSLSPVSAADEEPSGAVGLGRMFLGPVSAAGLEAIVNAFTALPVRVEEFVPTTMPASNRVRFGGRLGDGVLGRTCEVAVGGVDVVLDGTADPAATQWTRVARVRSLHTLCGSYIGSSSPTANVLLDLDARHIRPAALDGAATLGMLSVLGSGQGRLRIRLPKPVATAGEPIGASDLP